MKLINTACSVILSLALLSCGEKNDASTTESTSNPATEAAYPIDTCVVSGKELGSMGDPVLVEHEGTTVQLCCKHCTPKFEADPAKYVSQLKSEAEAHDGHQH